MARLLLVLFSALLGLASCAAPTPPTVASDGQPVPRIYRISSSDEAEIQFRLLDSVNALRQAAGAQPLEFDSRLNAAAATHSRDMSIQNRPWHFGSDGSSPLDRAQRVGYRGEVLGEAISETYETELQTLAAWMDAPETRAIILDRAASDIGFAWFQEPNGKIWWTLITGSGAGTAPVETASAFDPFRG